jgi:hypothetical protein
VYAERILWVWQTEIHDPQIFRELGATVGLLSLEYLLIINVPVISQTLSKKFIALLSDSKVSNSEEISAHML